MRRRRGGESLPPVIPGRPERAGPGIQRICSAAMDLGFALSARPGMTARARLTKRPAGFSYVNVIYIHARSTMPITAKLDEYGKPAWIALIVLGFLAWWPLGLAVLAFTLWS